jgi:hypothetical protein
MSTPQPASLGKGKSREIGIIGFTPPQPQSSSFIRPPMDIACSEEAALWPKRISPGFLPAPVYIKNADVPMIITARDEAQLGSLVFELIGWMLASQTASQLSAQPADQTLEELIDPFEPPSGATIVPSGTNMPRDPLVLIADNTSYYV